MTNPRTGPYNAQRLAAIKQQFTRPLPKVKCTPFPLAAVNPTIPSGTTTVALSEILETEASTNRSINYLPYVIVGAGVITLVIYLYLESQKTKKKEEGAATKAQL